MPSDMKKVWSATAFFRTLTETNKLAVEKGFRYVLISGLQGLEQAVESMQNTKAFVMVSENAVGTTNLDNSPRTRRTRTVFLAMRHKMDDMTARQTCKDVMAELHRQFMSKLILEKTRLEENMQFLEPQTTLQEAPDYLIPGTAICMFEITVDTHIDLQYNADEWITTPNN